MTARTAADFMEEWAYQGPWHADADDVNTLIAALVEAQTERDAAYVAIRWLRDGDEPIDVVAVSEAIRKAREAGK